MDSASHKQRIIALARQFIADGALIIDTETTGLGKDDEIIEIAIVDAADTFDFNALIKPSKPIPAEASKIHGITDAMVAHALDATDIWPAIESLIVGRPLLAYNSAFDGQMMQQTFGAYLEWDCLMNAWMIFHGLERWQRLETVCYTIGIQPGGHRALGDAKAAREVLRWLARQEG